MEGGGNGENGARKREWGEWKWERGVWREEGVGSMEGGGGGSEMGRRRLCELYITQMSGRQQLK